MPKLVVACPNECSLHPDKIGEGPAAIILGMRENGAGGPTMAKRLGQVLGHPIPQSSMSRHLKHYKEVDPNPGGTVDPSKRMQDLEILDLMIQRAAANSASWKPTIKDAIEAMKLKMQMTGNSAFDDLISLFDGAETDEAMVEAEEAIKSADERDLAPEDESEVLPDPFLGS